MCLTVKPPPPPLFSPLAFLGLGALLTPLLRLLPPLLALRAGA